MAGFRDTATHPAAADAFALAIAAGAGPPAYPGLDGHEPDLPLARRHAEQIAAATAALRTVAPDGACYPAESSYVTRHGVGIEAWSDDGFTRAG